MIVSLNEVETTILKAARGAGMAWGLAEEAAQAARWLAARRLPFESLFVSLLEAQSWRAEIKFADGKLRPGASGDCLCPIRAGAFLSDTEAALPIRIEKLSFPLLLAPFAARRSESIELQWDETTLQFANDRFWAPSDSLPSLTVSGAAVAEVRTADGWDIAANSKSPNEGGVPIDGAAWAKLQTFESRVYVPASLVSRLSGAGAALDDND
jgi:hypothetical protein